LLRDGKLIRISIIHSRLCNAGEFAGLIHLQGGHVGADVSGKTTVVITKNGMQIGGGRAPLARLLKGCS
jgi:hypothetical protein